MEFLELTQANFGQQLDRYPFMVIEFWAPWCEPCLEFSQICVELSASIDDVKFARINIDAQQELAADFNITSVPFMLIMRQRVILHAAAGLLAKPDLIKLINNARLCDLTAGD